MIVKLQDQIKYDYDSTGIFHWTHHRFLQKKIVLKRTFQTLRWQFRYIEDVLVTRQEISRYVYQYINPMLQLRSNLGLSIT